MPGHADAIREVARAIDKQDREWTATASEYMGEDGNYADEDALRRYDEARFTAGIEALESLEGWAATLDEAVNAMFFRRPPVDGDPTNADRAEWARQALLLFLMLTRSRPEEQAFDPTAEGANGEAYQVIGDLICNLLHLGRLAGANPDLLLETGRGHFEAEEFDAAETQVVETAEAILKEAKR